MNFWTWLDRNGEGALIALGILVTGVVMAICAIRAEPTAGSRCPQACEVSK